VELSPDPDELRDLLDLIRTARRQTDVVIVSLHAHEPGNRSETAADFIRDLARHAIDAGAAVVAAHGPRQLRGIEAYNGGAIFYSLGSFVFQPTAIAPGSETVFDTDVSAYDVALDAIQPAATPRLPAFEEPFWWESAMALLEFDGGTLRSIMLIPLDLNLMDAGVPRVAAGVRADDILQRLVRLSSPLGTSLNVGSGRAAVDLTSAPTPATR
jgi:poly-gamma-glutamate synthesis protein (capsule biosynthesis protein)